MFIILTIDTDCVVRCLNETLPNHTPTVDDDLTPYEPTHVFVHLPQETYPDGYPLDSIPF